jgi:CheY-like chemotaxis protein/HPt (histidine-containing phosphotransfer) domain-containing protein
VTDTGIGISEEARQRLFNPFTQVDGSIARRFGGTGLGLAICKKIVEALGGRIGVESVVGVGSKFWFEIPAARTERPAAPTQEVSRSDAALPRLKVLVVEDNEVNRKVAGRFLERLGQHAVLAEDGEAGVQAASRETFDVILMDMQMPGLDGIEATKQIRATGNATPIYALTANASERDRELCRMAGMNGFESKPVTMKRLSTLLAEIAAAHPREEAAVAEAAPPPAVAERPEPAPVLLAAPAAPAAVAETEPEGAIMGGSRMNELLSAVGEEEFQGIVDMFFADAPSMLREVAEAMAANDRVRIDRVLHNLKGAAATLGFERLAALAQSYRDSQPGETAVTRLEREIGTIAQHLQQRAA